MANLKEWILKEAAGEPVEAVVIGEMGWGGYGSGAVQSYADVPKGKLLTWKKAAKWLDFDFDNGYGSPGCMAVYAWTPSRVISVYQYDGSTHPYSIPRNPIDCTPEMVGG